ncbi:hypothetical protein [Nonomuraea turcica]|uniref:hypothetical protein n=1 Tax=Nonomuraea sp. G32 TaxID=3067274 RepID=UPI00273B1482|nr:hypothetical protein [Nonomuraea sp. G32]MDP4503731.1 hypothetical protein [Nonomuraea sp. G32]
MDPQPAQLRLWRRLRGHGPVVDEYGPHRFGGDAALTACRSQAVKRSAVSFAICSHRRLDLVTSQLGGAAASKGGEFLLRRRSSASFAPSGVAGNRERLAELLAICA